MPATSDGHARIQLLVYRFAPGAEFRGHLVGVLERMEAGGALRILDLLVVGSEGDSSETVALHLTGRSAGGVVAPLLDLRLGGSARERATKRTLAQDEQRGRLVQRLADVLGPGEALAALLIRHDWEDALRSAAAKTQGSEVLDAMVEPAELTALADELLAAARG